jgi:hypothetical protein
LVRKRAHRRPTGSRPCDFSPARGEAIRPASPDRGTAERTYQFVSEAIENIPAGYRARETDTIVSRDEFTERFEIAEPGKNFELYSEAHLKRSR